MALEEEPALTAPAIEVAEEPLAEIEDLRRAITRAEEDVEREAGGGSVAALVEQLLEWDRRLGAAGGDSWFTARGPDGERAASCRLFRQDGIGQVEDVGTLAHARRQGLGRAVTEAAARRSRARGDDLTFILADADDWPRLLYERIGFRPVGSAWTFRRLP